MAVFFKAGALKESNNIDGIICSGNLSDMHRIDNYLVEYLPKAYAACFQCAEKNKVNVLMFPVICYGLDTEAAVECAFKSCREYLEKRKNKVIKEIHFVVDAESLLIFTQVYNSIIGQSDHPTQ